MRVTYGVLGPMEAFVDGRPARLGGRRQRAVLAVLLLRAGLVVPIAVLVDAVWGEQPPVWAGNLLQGYVSGLRKELGRDSIETCEPGYRMTRARRLSGCAPIRTVGGRWRRRTCPG